MASVQLVVHARGHWVTRESDNHSVLVVEVVTGSGKLLAISAVDADEEDE